MRRTRKTWKIKPYSRIKESDKRYDRRRETETMRRSGEESSDRILGLDFGEKRVGVAISDPLKLTAHGLPTLVGKSTEEIIEFVKKVSSTDGVVEIVMGYPLLMSGDEGEIARLARELARRIEMETSIPVILWDERLSSRQAERIARATGSERRKEDVDRIAACLILQSYLDSIAG
jgi:putative Holliday junction resolvase